MVYPGGRCQFPRLLILPHSHFCLSLPFVLLPRDSLSLEVPLALFHCDFYSRFVSMLVRGEEGGPSEIYGLGLHHKQVQ